MDLDDCDRQPRFPVHDRDVKFGRAFDAVFHGEGMRVIRTPLQAPNANAHIERWVGSLRRECLDRLLILNHRHEAAFGEDLPGVPLFVHEADRDAVAAKHTVRAAFSQRHTLNGDREVIPTRGATAYLWDNRQQRFLLPATRSTCGTANGWPPSWTPATVIATSTASR